MIYRGLKRSLIDFSRHPWLHIVSISTISLSLFVLGTFFITYRNLDNVANRSKSQTSGTCYLKDGLTASQVEGLREQLLGMAQVKAVAFKTRQSIIDEIHTFLGSVETTRLPGGELFPDVLEVELKPDMAASELTDLKTAIAAYSEISEVDFSDDWMAQFKKIRQMFNLFGVLLMVGIVVGCGFIIANFMGMRHQARRHEIDIVRLHGGSRNFILAPFLWEGFIEGLLGATISLVALFIGKYLLGAFVSSQWASLLGVKELLYLSPLQLGTVVAIGIAMAFFGSITVFLRFQDNQI